MKKNQRLFKLPSIYFIADKEHRLDVCGYNFNTYEIISMVDKDKVHAWADEKDFNKRCKLFLIKIK